MTDTLDIPTFLRRDLTPQVRSRLDQLNQEVVRPELRLATEIDGSDWLRPRSVSVADWAAIQAERQAGRRERDLLKSRNRVAKLHARDAVPADFNHRAYRWDPRRGKFVPDGIDSAQLSNGPVQLASGLVLNDAPCVKPRKADDELARRLLSVAPGAEVKSFAQANGCWDAKYDKFNPGMQRMNVVNRLRAKVKKGHEVKWS